MYFAHYYVAVVLILFGVVLCVNKLLNTWYVVCGTDKARVNTGRPGGVSSYPRTCIDQFREFEPPRVHTRTRMNSWGIFLVHKLTCGKRESVS